MLLELSEREARHLLALVREEQPHIQSLQMMTSRSFDGVHLLFEHIAEDLFSIAGKLEPLVHVRDVARAEVGR